MRSGSTILLPLLLLSAPCAAQGVAEPGAAAPARTAFGVRVLGQIPTGDGRIVEPIGSGPLIRDSGPVHLGPVDLAFAARIGAQWGRVTSTRRSIAHNRAVGGVRNSYHLSGHAIDIARRAGVRHADIAAAFRRAGFHLIESLDEGDHSHFAFGGSGGSIQRIAVASPAREAGVRTASVQRESDRSWRIVTAPDFASR
jgi:hypothetical protein